MSTVFRSFFVCLAILLSGCATVPQAPSAGNTSSQSEYTPTTDVKSALLGSYKLGVGDQVRVIVFDEPDLSGEFAVDDSGQVSLPLVGQVRAEGYRISELKDGIVAAFKDGYLQNPRVSIEILRYRPFYISGEVEDDGEYPYVVGLTVPQAVATAGGYTRRANKNKVVIIRAGTQQRLEYPATQGTLVFPGDVLEVPERFF